VSYPKSNSLRDAASNVPLDRLLVETDAPFLAPQPKRGKRNEPAYIRHTLDCIAELKGQDAENLAQVTWANACTLFGLD
ncbi:MAG: TatD family hydrolase, partial [Planctomycetota bacterium]|nr:TatD family hydrolase [Planctomycetota bacterium]